MRATVEISAGAGLQILGTPMFQNRRSFAAAVVGAALAFTATPALAQTTDITQAVAGTYTLDINHTAVVARVPHAGFSYEIFRFTPTAGELIWDPASPAANRVNVTVSTTSIQTPVEGFAAELQGERFLNATQFPTATFVSTAFRQIDATHGQVDGDFTLKGVTKRIMFDVELIGAGPGMRGGHVIGFHATATINNADYSFPGFITGQTQIVIDAEFQKR
jgi:polyisoprenoid-binding protein YceI